MDQWLVALLGCLAVVLDNLLLEAVTPVAVEEAADVLYDDSRSQLLFRLRIPLVRIRICLSGFSARWCGAIEKIVKHIR